MRSEERAELVGSHADTGKDAAHGALEQVLAAVDWHGYGTPIRVAHDMVAAVDPSDGEAGALQGLDYLRSRYGRDSAGHKPARYYKSGDVECQSEFVRYAHFFDEKLKPGAEIFDRGFPRLALAERGDARTKLGGSAPAFPVFILLDDVGHVNDASHGEIVSHTRRNSTLSVRANTPSDGTSRDVLTYTGRTRAGRAPVEEGGSR